VDAEAVARVLAAAPVFRALSDAERTELVTHLRLRRSSRDEVVFHRDDAGGQLYVILSGSVKVAIPDEQGHEVVVAVERDGAVFGELALFDDAPRSATVTALDETQVVTLAREDFLRVLERSPRATREILRLLARTVRRASGRIEDVVFLDVPGRVAKCLLDLATAHARRRSSSLRTTSRPLSGDPGIGEPGPGGPRGARCARGRAPSHRGQGACAAAQTRPLLVAS
jgi:CRP/FNR family cyclic AMP-dependent transcriptional regulator